MTQNRFLDGIWLAYIKIIICKYMEMRAENSIDKSSEQLYNFFKKLKLFSHSSKILLYNIFAQVKWVNLDLYKLMYEKWISVPWFRYF